MTMMSVFDKDWGDGVDAADIGILETKQGGRIKIPDELRLKLAIYSSGICYIANGTGWDGKTRHAQMLSEAVGIPIRAVREVSQSDILEMYRAEVQQNPVALDIDRQKHLAAIIEKAYLSGASDIHLRVLKDLTEVRIRVHGRLQDLETRQASDGMPLIKAMFAVASDIAGAASEISFQQGALTAKSRLLPPALDMIRLQYTPESEGRGSVVMRLKPKANVAEMNIDMLGYNVQQMIDIDTMRKRTNGLYILAGKVSSGKTTTLQRVLNKMIVEKRREISMYTIEEPKELELPNAIQHPAKTLPDGTDGFFEGMKAALRSDLNVIVVGEIRSKMLADLAIQAVMTGHALWSTVHAGSALGILDRLSDFGIEPWKLQDPSVVRGLVYQRLCGVICPYCRMDMHRAVNEGKMEVSFAETLSGLFTKPLADLYIRGDGCPKCKGMGLIGRTVVAETCLTDPHLLDLFKRGERMEMRHYWTKGVEAGGMGGMPVMHHALSKVGAGICNVFEIEEEVDLVSSYVRDFDHLMPRLAEDTDKLKRTLKA